jgi:hypothetical protein
MPAKRKNLYAGHHELHRQRGEVSGEIVSRDGTPYYKINHSDNLPPFLMTIVSAADLWMFVSSNGALTAGRRNPDHAVFPYYTDDRIHDSVDITGGKCIIRVPDEAAVYLWEPFSLRYRDLYQIKRDIFKSINGDHLIFSEHNLELDLVCETGWFPSDKFGFIRQSTVQNHRNEARRIEILDGLQNILPSGATQQLQNEFSNLLDGYKKSELLDDVGLGLYALSSILTDKAEPSEALRAATVWSCGLADGQILLSSQQLEGFRDTGRVEPESDVRARRGAYFIRADVALAAQASQSWFIAADTGKDHSQLASLRQFLRTTDDLTAALREAMRSEAHELKQKLAAADGFQTGSDALQVFRHRSNTLFNIMRGGIFANAYALDKDDLIAFIATAAPHLAARHRAAINALPASANCVNLASHLAGLDPHLDKLIGEYLPLTFSRRHGDPSRPWNHFSIDLKDDQGRALLNYEGNWRDIFQNWEALAYSFPEYIENMIAKFVNASTADGYNPYRITRAGIDWEVPEPDNPWANIGYWGDHQIIYLLKLLELSVAYHPGKLAAMLPSEIFTYANVPYRIKSYGEMCRNPHDTIVFATEVQAEIEARVAREGEDGRLIYDQQNQLYQVNLGEKLLLPMLVKLSNFVPEAGIWMNTQRPEWNDANNALVGYGASVVTLAYLRRYVTFLQEFFAAAGAPDIALSEVNAIFFNALLAILTDGQALFASVLDPQERKKLVDALGNAGSRQRESIYKHGFSGQREIVSGEQIATLLQLSLACIDHSLAANRRDDGLYHAYNLLQFNKANGIEVISLYEMLEGQVAVLSSGYLSPVAAADLLTALRQSRLYTAGQNSYLLYPDRQLPLFIEKNNITAEMLASEGLQAAKNELLEQGILHRDAQGIYHFDSKYHNSRLMREDLEQRKDQLSSLTDGISSELEALYETVFTHRFFTGRSGTFYKYEGLGSIYWHMVSKLLLAVQENALLAARSPGQENTAKALREHYRAIKEGIGVHKNPALYGAFPTDAYSHTPKDFGAQQPGMTGQVKEDYIARFIELGIRIADGCIRFSPTLLVAEEFCRSACEFVYYDRNGKQQRIALSAGQLAFTLAQVPVVYTRGMTNFIIVTRADGSREESAGLQLPAVTSEAIFQRRGEITMIEVGIHLG